MTTEKIQALHDIGMPILKSLFELNSADLRGKIKEIVGNRLPGYDHLFCSGTVTKITVDDSPNKILIQYYDTITITWLGITFKPEHGTVRDIVDFDKFFTLK